MDPEHVLTSAQDALTARAFSENRFDADGVTILPVCGRRWRRRRWERCSFTGSSQVEGPQLPPRCEDLGRQANYHLDCYSTALDRLSIRNRSCTPAMAVLVIYACARC
jgi:hypothetical protein